MDAIRELMLKADEHIGELGHLSILIEDMLENVEKPEGYDEMVEYTAVEMTLKAIDEMFKVLEMIDNL